MINATDQKPHISVAPMMDWTDRHCRFFHRLIAPHVRLYTEMVTTGALIHGDRDRFLNYNAEEHPLALQLGGSHPDDLAVCARMAEDYGYDEVNLNCGCPSDRVQNGNFGACLMASPDLVARAVEQMKAAVSIPVTVKCRIGIDDADERPFLDRFVRCVAGAGCDMFIIHARKAYLQGLSPKENRDVPPLRYDIAAEIKQKYPHLDIIVNGGIKTMSEIRQHLGRFDGVMTGREAYQNPWLLAEIEKEIYGHTLAMTRQDIALAMTGYIERQQKDYGIMPKSVTRHMMGLFKGEYGGGQWRRYLSENANEDLSPATLIENALSFTLRQDEEAA